MDAEPPSDTVASKSGAPGSSHTVLPSGHAAMEQETPERFKVRGRTGEEEHEQEAPLTTVALPLAPPVRPSHLEPLASLSPVRGPGAWEHGVWRSGRCCSRG